MNPPFVRPTGMEGRKIRTGNPAFAAFNTSRAVQRRMQDSLADLRGESPIASGNAGLAADFLDLALRKIRPDGTIALVLPLSAVSGVEWEAARQAVKNGCADVIVVTIAGAGSFDASFSADTGMAECLLVARRGVPQREEKGTFVVLRRQVRSAQEAELLAAEVTHIREIRRAAGGGQESRQAAIAIGEQQYGVVLEFPLPESGPWPLVGIADEEIAEVAWALTQGRLVQLGSPNAEAIALPVVPIGQIAGRGPYHADIYWEQADGSPRGPFALRKPPRSSYPSYPMLWAHNAKRERRLVVAPDSEGEIKPGQADKAAQIWATATRAHYNRDLQFNSQSLIVAMTERPTLGGRAWPSVIFNDPEREYAFALWCNSTLGLLLHWWSSNKTQSGRGTTTVTGIPNISTLDIRTLTPEQHAAARTAFTAMHERWFLPFDQIDEDPARAELDRRLLVDVLGLPESLCAEHGPMDLLRRKLVQEPQIHGGKRSRVVFNEAVDAHGNTTATEHNERRYDR